ncbi:MAG TPA: hypothetical protein VF219_02920 [Vicinamibacterales bacterium]
MKIDTAVIRSLPKVLLHDHLDGGLRPQTIVDLARDQRYCALPSTDAGDLARWFHRGVIKPGYAKARAAAKSTV